MKEEVKKYEEEQQQLNNQIFDLQHEQEKYSTVMKENQQKIKYYHSEVKAMHSHSHSHMMHMHAFTRPTFYPN